MIGYVDISSKVVNGKLAGHVNINRIWLDTWILAVHGWIHGYKQCMAGYMDISSA